MSGVCWAVCLNDFPEFVITESEEEANKAKDKIRDLEYEGKYKTQYTYEEYKHRFFWHVRTIKIFKKAEEV